MLIVILHAAFILALAFTLAKHWQATRSKIYWLSFAFHLIGGISVGMIYTYYYSANDTWLFFEDAKKLSQLARHDLLSYFSALVDFSDAMTTDLVTQDFRSMVFIKLLSLFALITGDSYWLCAAYLSLLSFVASWFLWKRITTYFEESQTAGALAFLIFPSVVFWSSGIEKETLTLSALYFLAGLFLEITFKQKVSVLYWALAFVAGFVLWALKYYWAGVFFIAVITAVMLNYFSAKQAAIKKYLAGAYIACFVLIGIGISFLHPNFYMTRFLEVVVENNNAFMALSSNQSSIHFYELSPTLGGMAINAPWAFVSGIFRPFIGEGQGVLGLAASLENLSILVLAIGLLWSHRKHLGNLSADSQVSILFLTAASYCVVLCIFLALSTPNFGTLSRYRVGFLPFLIFILSYRNPLIDFIAKRFDLDTHLESDSSC